ncbi:hypothetical protein EG830_03745 [bacterium]|nr:hypothetical protein [bacterium]
MKKVILFVLVLFAGLTMTAQDLQKLATKGAVRLFSDKDDLTSVLQIIPDGTVVEAISADTVFTLIRLGDLQGYVKSDRLTAALPVVTTPQPVAATSQPAAQPAREAAAQPVSRPVQEAMPEQVAPDTQYRQVPTERYQALSEKYGAELGLKLYQHKVWKGITSDMARDSWGKPKQVNRMYVDASVDEEWIYSRSYLYFRDGVLIDWGPVK